MYLPIFIFLDFLEVFISILPENKHGVRQKNQMKINSKKGWFIFKIFSKSVFALSIYQPENGLLKIDKKHSFISLWLFISKEQKGKARCKEPWLLWGIIQLKTFIAVIKKIPIIWTELNELKNFLILATPIVNRKKMNESNIIGKVVAFVIRKA